eukprot:c17890_g1_i1.p1 GENE.c17890_g1_i1~~c17890_g1_i1.p1  ORF type:complete len:193 (-),score=51.07 c17890_g1_i1:73-627(-)
MAEEFLLPKTCVLKVVRSVLPQSVTITKDSKDALSMACSVFCLYLANAATETCASHGRSTVSRKDLADALREIDMELFVAPLEEFLDLHKQKTGEKKKAGKRKREEGDGNDGDDDARPAKLPNSSHKAADDGDVDGDDDADADADGIADADGDADGDGDADADNGDDDGDNGGADGDGDGGDDD